MAVEWRDCYNRVTRFGVRFLRYDLVTNTVFLQNQRNSACAGGKSMELSFRYLTKYMREFMNITKALSDPNRVRILLALRQGELCVCQITELFGFAPSTISKHLSVLHQAGLILSRKAERWVYYRLPDKSASTAVREALAWVHKSVAETNEAIADAKSLKKILATDLAEICRRQRC